MTGASQLVGPIKVIVSLVLTQIVNQVVLVLGLEVVAMNGPRTSVVAQ